jgi:CheY-like chemotaxis protein
MASQFSDSQGAIGKELESLLIHVERATTHYDALDLPCSATSEEIRQAYQRAVNLLHPSFQPPGDAGEPAVGSSLTREQILRIDKAFDRVSLAFSVLANVAKRADYDRFVVAKTGTPHLPPNGGVKPVAQAPPAAHKENNNRPPSEVAEDNRRRSQRFNLAVPAQVVGYDRKNGKWEEVGQTVNVSRTGVRIRMHRRVRHGAILHLALPLPPKLRNHGYSDASYRVYALVRRVEPCKKGVRVIGLEFVGEHPPAGYLDKPWATFQTKRWGGQDRRRKPREQRADVVWVEYFTESMQCIRQEAGRTEDVSDGGMRVCVKSAPSEFELVKVSRPNQKTESFAEVCNRFFGKDGMERLCLKYLTGSELAARTSVSAEIAAASGAKRNEASPVKAEPSSVEQAQAEHAKAEYAKAEHAPQAQAVVEPIKPVEQIKEETIRPATKTARILVADDDPPLRKVIGKILTTAGYQVTLVEDGKAAVEKAKAEKPDLVITDGLMPKMHGFLVCKTIKEMPSPPKVIMITAVYTKMQYKWEAKEKYGADDLLTKPFEVSELLACIEKQLSDAPRAEAIPA